LFYLACAQRYGNGGRGRIVRAGAGREQGMETKKPGKARLRDR